MHCEPSGRTRNSERDEKADRKEGKRPHKPRAFGLEDTSEEDNPAENSEQEENAMAAANEPELNSDSSENGDADGELLATLSDEEDRETFAQALLAVDLAKKQIKVHRRNFAQAKAVVREIRKSRFPRKPSNAANTLNLQKPFRKPSRKPNISSNSAFKRTPPWNF